MSDALATLHRDLEIFGVDVLTLQWDAQTDQLNHLLIRVGVLSRGGVQLRLLRDLQTHRAMLHAVWGMALFMPHPVRPPAPAGLEFMGQRNQHTGARWSPGSAHTYTRITSASWYEILDEMIVDAQDIARGRTVPTGTSLPRTSPWRAWMRICQDHGLPEACEGGFMLGRLW